jgi:hypothetical protein
LVASRGAFLLLRYPGGAVTLLYAKLILMPNQFNTSLWGDEGFSAILSMKSLPEIIKTIITDTSPPLWNITEWIVFNTLGTDEIYIRGLAFTFFLIAVFFTYKIGALLWDKKTGVLSAVLTFLNPFFFIYAFEGRMYSILAAGVTASMYFFLKILRSKKKVETFDKVGFVAATLWAMYSHHFAIFAVFLQGLWFLREYFFGKRKVAVTIFKLFIAVGIGYLPWIYPLYNQTKMVGGGFWLGTPTVNEFFGLLEKYLGAGVPHQLAKTGLIFVLVAVILRRWSKKSTKIDFFLLSWFLVPIALTWIISQLFQSIFFDRYLIYTIPAAMLIVSSRARKLTGILLAAIVAVFAIIDFHYFTHPTKRPFRELAAYVKETRQEGDFLINWNAASHHLWETKYYGIPAPIYVPGGEELPFFVGTALMEEEDVISKFPEGTARVGVVTSGPVDEVNLPGYTLDVIKNLRHPWAGAADINFVWYQKD